MGAEPAMRRVAAELVERARVEGVDLTGEDGLLTALVREVLQTGLEVEMTEHLGYERHALAAGLLDQLLRELPVHPSNCIWRQQFEPCVGWCLCRRRCR